MRKILFIIILFSALIVRCTKEDASHNAARLRFSITGTPADTINELVVDIQQIEVLAHNNEDNSEEWIPLEFSGKRWDMKKLSNGEQVQLSDQFFPANKTIQKVKIIFGDNNKILTTKGEKQLSIPTKIADGVVVDAVVHLYPYVICSVIIDLHNVVAANNATGNYLLDPFIRIYPETFGGSLTGVVTPPEARARIKITNHKPQPDTLISFPNSDGKFLYRGLEGGEWKVHVLAHPLSGFRDTVFIDSVEIGKVNQLRAGTIYLKPINPPK